MRPCLTILLLVTATVAAAQQTVEEEVPSEHASLRLGGFTDLNFFATDDEGPAATSGFQEGQFVLHFNSALSPRIFFFAELSVTARPSEFRTEVERTIIRFDQSDQLKVSFGRYHTPINWWNTAFHHGQWLQTTVSRPEMTRFGGDFIPVHFVGGLVEGAVPVSGVSLGYKAGLGNGRHEIISRAGDSGDVNNSRAWLLSASLRPDRLYDLQVGSAFYRDTISMTDARFREQIASGWVAYTKERPEVIAELARTRHEDKRSGESWTATAWYVQLAFRPPLEGARWKPYVRWERINVEEDDPVYASLTDRRGVLGGVRYDLSDLVAVKLEYRHQRSNHEPHVNGAFTQVSFAF